MTEPIKLISISTDQPNSDPLVWVPMAYYAQFYLISTNGDIKSLHSKNLGRLILPRVDRAGYITVRLSRNGKTSTKYLHRLLAETFIANTENKKHVNHLNGNKQDNRLCNLEWSTHSENIKHAYQIGLCSKTNKQTPVIDINSNKRFDSIKEAASYFSIPYSTCKGYLNGQRKNITYLQKSMVA